MVDTEKLAAYYQSAQEEKEKADKAAGKGKASPTKDKEIEDYAAEVKRQTGQQDTTTTTTTNTSTKKTR